jgi:hypothetical protein
VPRRAAEGLQRIVRAAGAAAARGAIAAGVVVVLARLLVCA